ncbi:hypothetical protein K4K58_012281 [Colletotrichum sp. SAR11_239]|nr:hypothetical protein K4K58_012281 [Colletotrichum sp. SAR11_239]
MNRIPQEIVDLIASRLPEPRYRRSDPPWIPSPSVRPSIATVSNKFRHAIERLTFRELRIVTSEIDTLDDIFSRASVHRRSFLKDLHVVVLLPAHDEADWGTFDFDADREANNDAATKGMDRLLCTLSGWNSAIRLAVTLEMQPLSATGPLTSEEHNQRVNEIRTGLRCEDHRRYAYSFIEMYDIEKMPLVPGAMRRQLTESLRSARFPSTLASFDFQLDSSVRTTGDLSTSPNPQPDRLCEALHHAVNDISHLKFTGQVDASLFWPYQSSETPKPFWQSMKTMDIVMDKDSTSSEWYLRYRYDIWSYYTIEWYGLQHEIPIRPTLPPPGHGSTNEARLAYSYIQAMQQYETDVWQLTEDLIDTGVIGVDDDEGDDEKVYNEEEDRENKESIKGSMLDFCQVNESAMAPLLEAMMKAMLQMPCLEFVRLSGFLSQAWAFEFYAPNIRSKHDSNTESDSPPSYHRFILPEYFWVPGKDILDGFLNMAKEKYGQEPVIVCVDRIQLGH